MIDQLLSPARIESLAPEPGASEAAWDEVCRRRRTRNLRAQVAAGVGLVAVVMVGLLPSLDDGGRAAELDVAGRETTDARIIERPSITDDEPDDSPQVPDGPSDAAGRGPGPSPNVPAAAPSADQPRPGAQAPTPGRTKPVMERSRYETINIGCIDWCLQPHVLKEGDDYALNLDLCVAVGGRVRRFSFATTQELDMWVATGTANPETLWTWSLGQQFSPNEHHLDIAPGECVRWRTLWDATDERGEDLEPGNYRLYAKSLAEQTAPNSTTETTFQIT